MALATLSVDLVARLASLEQGFDKSARLAERNAAQMAAAYKRVDDTITTLKRTIGGLVTVEGLRQFFVGTVDGIDKLNDLKDATGASIENLSALEDVAVRTGSSFDTVGEALVKFNKTLGDAKPGSDAAAALEALGLRAEELKKLDPAEALQRTAKALNQFADDGNKARLIQELFGKSVREVAPFLKDLGERTQLVGKLTAEQTEAAESFNKQLAELKKNSIDAGRALVLDLLPSLSKVLQQFAVGREVFGGGLKGFEQITSLNPFADRVDELLKWRKALQDAKAAEDAIASGEDGSRFSIFGKDRLEAAKQNTAQVQKFVTLYEKLLGLQAGADNSGAPPGLDVLRKAPDLPTKPEKDKQTEAERFIEALQQQTVAALDLTKVEEVQLLLAGKLAGATAKEREEILALAAGLDALKAKVPTEDPRTAFRRSELDAQPKDSEALQFFGKQIEDANRELDELSGRIEQERKRILTARLEARLAAGEVFSPEELDRIVKGIGGIRDAAEDAKGVAEELGFTFASAFEDALVGGKKLGDVLKGLEQDLIRIITRKAVTEPLAGAVTDLFKPSGGGSGFDFGALLGKVFSSFSGFFADGGFIPPGQWGIAGERRPEAVYGGRTGMTVLPSGGGTTVVQNFHLAQPTDRRSQSQLGAEAAFALSRAQRNL